MISDANFFFLIIFNIVTKQCFSCRKSVISCNKFFSHCKRKNFHQEKKCAKEKKCLVTISIKIFLLSENISVNEK